MCFGLWIRVRTASFSYFFKCLTTSVVESWFVTMYILITGMTGLKLSEGLFMSEGEQNILFCIKLVLHIWNTPGPKLFVFLSFVPHSRTYFWTSFSPFYKPFDLYLTLHTWTRNFATGWPRNTSWRQVLCALESTLLKIRKDHLFFFSKLAWRDLFCSVGYYVVWYRNRTYEIYCKNSPRVYLVHHNLKGPAGQIRFARERYQWIGLSTGLAKGG